RQRLAIRRRGDDAEHLAVVRVEERVRAQRERTEVRLVALREQDLLAGERDGREPERDESSHEKHRDEREAAAIPVLAQQSAMPSEEHPLDLDIRARQLSPLRPSHVTTPVWWHCSNIVLETAVREAAPAVLRQRARSPAPSKSGSPGRRLEPGAGIRRV